MDLMDSLKWVFFSQQIYRLAAFRLNSNRSKLITDNLETFGSFFYISLITVQVAVVGYETYFMPGDGYVQVRAGKSGKKLISWYYYEINQFTLADNVDNLEQHQYFKNHIFFLYRAHSLSPLIKILKQFKSFQL